MFTDRGFETSSMSIGSGETVEVKLDASHAAIKAYTSSGIALTGTYSSFRDFPSF